ncbi:hypothetical protein OGAPHI_003310 [Ogataea philodendri]|uniref:MI domain-containing protein n=1 Tax=Ogataea philodendri TaxID=1378263 RepID=A0A9P8T6D7_9ASCO|nr:uncharacterized protein OGAPHI_003310 [Ogataea philodendri]KAH3666861.1 hypothetical protein OGAPHI_003310 [Ogataea philodendri]
MKRNRHGVNIPGALLDQISESGRYENDKRFVRGKQRVSRKERRKQQREEKKRRRDGDGRAEAKRPRVEKKKKEDEVESEGEEDEFAGFEDEFSGFDDAEQAEEESEEEESEEQEDELDDEQKDVMAQLMKMKGKKQSSGFKVVKEDDLEEDALEEDELENDLENDLDEESSENVSGDSSDDESEKYDDPEQFDAPPGDYADDIDYYARKLGISKKSSLKKTGDDDIVGGLLDGLEMEEEEEEEDSSTESLGDEDRELLEEMEGLQSSDEESDSQPAVRENPYVAPVAPGKYVPPSLRRKLLESTDSEEMLKITRSVKGPFNRLSEPQVMTVVNELNQLYAENPRQIVNEAIIKVVFQSVLVSTPMLDSFLVLYATAIVALYGLQGVEFGAYAIQSLVEKLCELIEAEEQSKQASNLIGLIGFCYELNLLSSRLVYDIILDKLISNPTEFRTELLLKLIRSCGYKLRSDDPTSLKEIVLLLNKNVAANSSTRARFLVETVSNLKNNKLKSIESEATSGLVTRCKKQLGRIRSGDPIKVSLNDIESIKEKGKWWLVGSAWKGQENQEQQYQEYSKSVTDALDSSEPNWLELAKQHRMNTDIRRAIFVSIMSATDYMDAFAKLEKLGLRKTQQREIPRILMHCVSIETAFNPYYAFLAKKLCQDHGMRKTLQFNLWDLLKELEGEDEDDTSDLDDDQKLRRILNLGRLYGHLVGEGSIPLNVLRTVNFLTATEDTRLFVEIFMITFLDVVAKLSEEKMFGGGDRKLKTEDMKYTQKTLVERLSKCKEQPTLLKGLSYFLQEKIRNSSLIKGKKQKARVQWGVDSMADITGDILSQFV